MSFLATAIPAVLQAGVSIIGASKTRKAAKNAAAQQVQAAQMGIDELRRQFEQTRSDVGPWRDAGQGALSQQMAILGLNPEMSQQSVIDQIMASPQWSSMLRQGDESILHNASATGGLRGGNNISDLANFRTDLLARLLDQQYARLGSISSGGAQTGLGIGQMGANMSQQVAGLFGEQGAARAGSILSRASASNTMLNSLSQSLGQMFGGNSIQKQLQNLLQPSARPGGF